VTDRLKVFISYRRADCMVHAGRLAENLTWRAGAEVFLDVESIPLGVSFPEWIDREIAACDAVLVVIGDDWLALSYEGDPPRIESPSDWVRVEIEAALERGVLTIPVLVEGTTMPHPDQLPDSIRGLAYRNAAELRDSSWSADFERIAAALERSRRQEEHQAEPHPSWPGRFTDSWFATNVPRMDPEQLEALRHELQRRNWTEAELAERVLVHANATLLAPDAPSGGSTDVRVGRWPGRFTDSWFATNVPRMGSQELEALRHELHWRTWTDAEIAERVLVHAQSGTPVGDAPTGVDVGGDDWPTEFTHSWFRANAPSMSVDTLKRLPTEFRRRGWTETEIEEWALGIEGGMPSEAPDAGPEVDESDLIARATLAAGTDLEVLDSAGHAVRERHLAEALAAHLDHATVERRLEVPGWDPKPGNVDLFTTDWWGRPKLVVETKHKDGNQIYECLWDMAKVLSLDTETSVEGAYLVTGTTVRNWTRPVPCAELFETGRHELVATMRRYPDLWEDLLAGGRARPLAVPENMDVSRVARVPLVLQGERWELRAIRVSTPDPLWTGFRDGRPPAD